MLAKSKLNSIETLISEALIDIDISHGEFIRILEEKDKYEKMKYNLRSENKKSNEIMRLSSKNSKTYRKELTPNITFQPNKIFARNDLFEKIIKSCKATDFKLLKLKEKLGLCLYKTFAMNKRLFQCQKKNFKDKKRFTQHDVGNKQLKEENEKIRKEENEQLKKDNVKYAEIKESIEKPTKIKNFEEDKI